MPDYAFVKARIHARLPCDLVIHHQAIDGVTHNISEGGIYLRVAEQSLAGLPLGVGSPARVRLRLPQQPAGLTLDSEVRWIKPDDCDADGRAVIGLGMKVESSDEASKRELCDFIQGFRYPVLVFQPDAAPLGERLLETLQGKYRVIPCDSAEQAFAQLESQDIALIAMGERALEQLEMATLRRWVDRSPFSQIVVQREAEACGSDRFREFIALGKIFHSVPSSVDGAGWLRIIDRAVEAYVLQAENTRVRKELSQANHQLHHEVTTLRKRLSAPHGLDGMIGTSPAFLRVVEEIRRIAGTDVTVHIRGETGTGKELIARALHRTGLRKDGPFVPQNCGGLTETLIESTLFGHRKGAFTGAVRDHVGALERAHGGTLFLDEVGELPLSLQASLLRVLQDGLITPLGAEHPRRVDVRILSATNKDLKREVEQGRFRQDLYYRLVVAEIALPPLRDRRADIPILVQHFYEVFCARHRKALGGVSGELMGELEGLDWPGNVRELENTLERLVVMAEPDRPISRQWLSPSPQPMSGIGPPGPGSRQESVASPTLDGWIQEQLKSSGGLRNAMEELERRIILTTLARCAQNISQAARELGLPRQTLQSCLKRFLP